MCAFVRGLDSAGNFSFLCVRLGVLSFCVESHFQLLVQILLMIFEYMDFEGGSGSRCACLQFLSFVAGHGATSSTRTNSVVTFLQFCIAHIIHFRDTRSCVDACLVCSAQC